jgi:RsiW-degrading membrane proteinase PrsW (M82 family)
MEVALILALFFSSAIALDCLYNQRIKSTGALLIVNLCLTVALAYQFKQMEKIFYIFLCVVGAVIIFFGVRFYLRKKKERGVIIDADESLIEEKDE